jgi:nicotinamide mononucleotide transporter
MTHPDTTPLTPATPAGLVLEYEAPREPKRTLLDLWAPPLLVCVTAAVAAVMYALGRASLLEAISFVTGALCVWLTVRESAWNFPVSLLNVATFAVVFYRVRLFADASLQVVYFVLTAVGWYLWLYGGERRTALRVSRAAPPELAGVIGAGIVLTVGLWQLLRHVGGSASFWDASTTAISLCAQWLLNRKRIENWYFWIAADLIYIPLYAYKGLALTSLLYATFLAMCLAGLSHWRATWRASRLVGAPGPEAA